MVQHNEHTDPFLNQGLIKFYLFLRIFSTLGTVSLLYML